MTTWAERIRVEAAGFDGTKGTFRISGKFVDREEYERARNYIENIANASVKGDIVDALVSENNALEQSYKEKVKENQMLELVLRRTQMRLEALEQEVLPLYRSLGLALPALYNEPEVQNGPHGRSPDSNPVP